MSDTKTIKEIQNILSDQIVTDQQLEIFSNDQRKGVQTAIKQYYRRLQREREMKAQLCQMCKYEQAYYDKGLQYIVGVDEVGRGPLAGPVVAAAVILDPDKLMSLMGVNDSKQLSRSKREMLYEKIKAATITSSFGIIDNQTIDRINIYQATIEAMKQAIKGLAKQPEHLLIDAVKIPNITYSMDSIVKGDQKSISIAAASILAKVKRDNIMASLHEAYPVYAFNKNQGYGTKEHLNAIQKYGITPYHRQSFAPVK